MCGSHTWAVSTFPKAHRGTADTDSSPGGLSTLATLYRGSYRSLTYSPLPWMKALFIASCLFGGFNLHPKVMFPLHFTKCGSGGGRVWEGQRETTTRERHRLVASCRRLDRLGVGGELELATQTCAFMGNGIHSPSVHGPWLEPLSPTGQGWISTWTTFTSCRSSLSTSSKVWKSTV